MKLERAKDKKQESTIRLAEVKPGEVFRFSHDSVEDAFKSDLFWMRLDAPESKDRVRIVNFSDGKQLERDGDHRVITHKCKLSVF